MVLTASDISKSYGGHPVLRGVALAVAERRTLSILGRSGCGKTTLLKIIAGLIDPDGGEILLRGASIAATPIARRSVVYIYQEPLLFPHLPVFENIAFGLRLRKMEKARIEAETRKMIAALGLEGHADKMPGQLSGGQKQRVAFGRAIIINPAVLLLDEPFSNLDAETRGSMQELYLRLVEEYAIASIFVTHDLKEAIVLGDSIAYMHDGMLINFPTKQAFIEHPEYGAAREMAFWRSLG